MVLSDSVVSFIVYYYIFVIFVVVVLRILLYSDFLEVESESKRMFVLVLFGVPILVLIIVSEFLEDEVIVEWEEYSGMLILILFDLFSEISWFSD